MNLLNSGEPYSNLTVCNTLASLSHNCGHGTHVAGIAAGRKSTNITPTNLQGVGPDANIVSVQVFSYNNTSPKAAVFSNDVQKALETVLAAATLPGTTNPYVINMRIGFTDYSSSLACCNNANPSVATTVASLTSRGIPVVGATGNNSDKEKISWPACISQAVKVSSVANDASGTALAGFANIGNPASFVGPILLAPGGSNTTTVLSADRTSTTATNAFRGTSQATPHASGIYYAALKAANSTGLSVADATAWIVTTGSIPVTYTSPSPVNTQTYRRIRIPNP
ncbi:MAG: S8 family serine peptidase [Proteobacteria bacterium]|nr:S8 family serine peptidase [Pseudomonadota bacterium]